MARITGRLIFQVFVDQWVDITPLVTGFRLTHGSRFSASPERPIPYPATGSLFTIGERWQGDPIAEAGQQRIRIILFFDQTHQTTLWSGLRESPRVTDERAQRTTWRLVDANEAQLAQRVRLRQTVQGRQMNEFLEDSDAWRGIVVPELAGVDDSVALGLFDAEDVANRTVGRLALMMGGVHGHRKDGTLVIAGLNPSVPNVGATPFILYDLKSDTAINHIRNVINFSFDALAAGVPLERSQAPTIYTASSNSGFGNDITFNLDIPVAEGFGVSNIAARLEADMEYSAGTTTRQVQYQVRVPVRREGQTFRTVRANTNTLYETASDAENAAAGLVPASGVVDGSISTSSTAVQVPVEETNPETRTRTATATGSTEAAARSAVEALVPADVTATIRTSSMQVDTSTTWTATATWTVGGSEETETFTSRDSASAARAGALAKVPAEHRSGASVAVDERDYVISTTWTATARYTATVGGGSRTATRDTEAAARSAVRALVPAGETATITVVENRTKTGSTWTATARYTSTFTEGFESDHIYDSAQEARAAGLQEVASQAGVTTFSVRTPSRRVPTGRRVQGIAFYEDPDNPAITRSISRSRNASLSADDAALERIKALVRADVTAAASSLGVTIGDITVTVTTVFATKYRYVVNWVISTQVTKTGSGATEAAARSAVLAQIPSQFRASASITTSEVDTFNITYTAVARWAGQSRSVTVSRSSTSSASSARSAVRTAIPQQYRSSAVISVTSRDRTGTEWVATATYSISGTVNTLTRTSTDSAAAARAAARAAVPDGQTARITVTSTSVQGTLWTARASWEEVIGTTTTTETVTRYRGTVSYEVIEGGGTVTYRTETRTRTVRNTERRVRRLEVVTVEPTVTDITGGKRAEATFEIPDAWSGREVFDDAEGFAVPPASGAIWGTDQGQLTKVTLSPYITYTVGATGSTESVTVESPASIEQWGRRPMDMPAWFAGSKSAVEARVQSQLDRAATARQQHVLTIPLSQDSVVESINVADIDALTYIDLRADYPVERVNVEAVVLVLERSLEWTTSSPLRMRLVCVETATAPTSLPAGVPRNFTGSAIDDVSVRLSWQRGTGGAPMAYTVRHRLATSTAEQDWVETTFQAPAGIISGLTATTAYVFQVKADESDWTEPITVTTLAPAAADAPTNLMVDIMGRTASLTWGAPTAGGRVTGYRFRYRVDGSSTWTTVDVMTATSGSAVMLDYGTDYNFQVQAYGPGGAGAWSQVVNADTDFIVVPNLAFTRPSPTSVGLTWDALPGATRYGVEYRLPGESWTAVTDRTVTNVTITGLEASTVYDFRVRPESPDEDGPWRTVQILTATDLVAPDFMVEPSPADESLIIRVSGYGTEPAGITYWIRWKLASGSNWKQLTVDPVQTDITTGTIVGRTYDVEMQARSVSDISDWSASKQVTLAGATVNAFAIITEDGDEFITEDGDVIVLEDAT